MAKRWIVEVRLVLCNGRERSTTWDIEAASAGTAINRAIQGAHREMAKEKLEGRSRVSVTKTTAAEVPPC